MRERGTITAPPLLDELARAGIKLRLGGDGRLEVTAPRGRLSGDLRDRIGRHKPELVDWLTRVGAERPPETALPRITHDEEHLYEPFVPPDLQVSFLIGSREGSEYHVRPHTYMEFELSEAEAGRLEDALNDELARQRKNIVVALDDLRLQTVRDLTRVSVEVYDLRGAAEAERRAHCDRVRAEMSRLEPPHDRWPWLDMRVSLLGAGRARVHYNHNNLFSDAPGAFGFIGRVLGDCRNPGGPPRPELRIAYRDCVLALAELEASPLGQASREYWMKRIPELPGAPEIPLAAGADPRTRSYLRRRRLVFAEPVWAALRKRAEARSLTVTAVLTSIQAEVLSYWSGSRHFLINNMITHRHPMHPQLDEIFGNFASLYPLEVDWRRGGAFHERVRRLQTQIMADVEHCHWSGVKVLQALNQERGTPGRAICPYALGSAFFVGKTEQPSYTVLETPQTLIDIEFWALPDGELWVTWDVIETMFPEGLVDAMDEAFRSLLTRLADDDLAWETDAFDLLPAGQREQRARLNGSAPPVRSGLLHDALSRWAAETPAAPAVVAADAVLNYAGLERLAGRIAARLREHGTRPGDLVAVALSKGAGQVAAVLGALTAGAAYVPVDPGWPRDRIDYVLRDTGATAVLAGAAEAADLAAGADVPVLRVDAAGQDDGAGSVTPAERRSGDLAYVIYTSGSTGRPKGAMLDHRGPLNTVTDVNRRFGVTATDVLFGVSSLCFDLSVYDIFGALEAGARLVLPAPGSADPASWVEAVRAHEVTVWNSVPALMQLFTEEAEAAGVRCPSLRTVLLSGDWVPVDLPPRIRRIAPNARVISLGGATEASIWSICHPVDHHDPDWTSVPYGKPLAGQTWHVLDEQGRDAPTWVPGHLYVGGAGVALGYLGDPVRTEAAFVSHPRTGERLYRTGDLGRYLPDGDIEFLGRADFQVKIQGFRVEPGEIEHALLGLPAVERAVVVARGTGSGRQLVAFVTVDDGAPRPDTGAMRDALAARLPAYMVPDHITVLDRLPLTANGKLDRRSLESLAPSGEPAGRRYVAPRDELERALTVIWESILDTRPIGVHDDFFELGGQSYAAVRLIGQVARSLGHRVSLGVLLECRTVAALADRLSTRRRAWSPLVRLRETGGDAPWFLVHPAGGGVLCYRELAGLLDRPCYALQADDTDPPERVEDLAELYVGALVEARPHGPYLLGGWSSGAVIALEMARRLEVRGEKVDRVVVVDAPAPLAPRDVDDARVLLWFLEDLDAGLDVGRIDAERLRELDGLPPAERIRGALSLLRAAGAPETGLEPEELARTLEVFRGVVRACNAYQATAISAGITVVRARDGSVSEFADHPSSAAPDWGWASLTTGDVRAVSVPGTHHTLLGGPSVSAVADALNGR